MHGSSRPQPTCCRFACSESARLASQRASMHFLFHSVSNLWLASSPMDEPGAETDRWVQC